MAIEIERKFAITAEQSLPDLAGVAGIEQVGDPREHQLSATYFDTPDLLLARNRITLRRRTGGTDAGWHLKLPQADGARLEVHEPILADSSPLLVPAALRGRVSDLIGYAVLVPVAQLLTRRIERDLLGANAPVALLCDDHVTAVSNGGRRSWRELEVELTGAGAPALLDGVAAAFAEHGIHPADSPSKLVQALGPLLPAAEEKRELSRKSSAGAVLQAYLVEQIGVIQGRAAEVRADEPDAVHKMRVATRRLRSALQTFSPLLRPDAARPLRLDLKWLAGLLGGPRDAEVMRDHLLGLLPELPEASVVGPVAERLTSELNGAHDRAHRDLVEGLDSPRYRNLAEALVGAAVSPITSEAADARAKGVLPPLLEATTKRVVRQWHKAQKATGSPRLHRLHETRKRAKAARYACEAVASVFPDAGKLAGAWTQVTESLGTVQDAVVTGERLVELAAAAAAAGESTFTYGVLYQRELERASASQDDANTAMAYAQKLSAATW
ncbi:CYTH and CHAD domain-containing protein [Granulicoccus phenolivorans]|uniref:CYTH and CHAD domain-containing protein n=1 Tax=Granulicoccus phenolivorans TaxID=266854 RepID=UPI000408E374|nr:CYTH and CHAD domain-containing protein [Granulicoccus phenolivorans]